MKDILVNEGGGFFPDVANIDPPRHTRVRRLLSQAFSRRRMKAFEPQFESLVDELIDGFVERGKAPLPKLNTGHPPTREFLLGVAEHWLRFGVDGWRLDVPGEIDDRAFWQEFRRRCRAIDRDAYLVGELWDEAPDWLEGDRFDAEMNYPLGTAILGFIGGDHLDQEVIQRHDSYRRMLHPLDGPAFARRLETLMTNVDPAVVAVQLNLIGSHDAPRALTILGGDRTALRLAMLVQATLPGAPCIYYGDEIGLDGDHDPDNRRAYPADPTRATATFGRSWSLAAADASTSRCDAARFASCRRAMARSRTCARRRAGPPSWRSMRGRTGRRWRSRARSRVPTAARAPRGSPPDRVGASSCRRRARSSSSPTDRPGRPNPAVLGARLGPQPASVTIGSRRRRPGRVATDDAGGRQVQLLGVLVEHPRRREPPDRAGDRHYASARSSRAARPSLSRW